MTSKYEPPPIHPLNDEEQEFVNSLNTKELALHMLAVEKLASSYFVWKTPAFQAWKQSKNANSK